MKKTILLLVLLMMIGCDDVEGGEETTTPTIINDKVTQTPIADSKSDKLEWTYVEIDLDDMSFEDAFEIQYLAKGEGRTFWWRGILYTTNLHENEAKWLIHDSSQWVRNSDDLDDRCYSNEFDECGVCDGPGKPTWYKDWDEDGLGNPNISMQSCIYPSVDEE